MFTLVICSVLLGIVLTLVIQALLMRRWFASLPVLSTPKRQQFNKFELPKELRDILPGDDHQCPKETCQSLNLIFQFLFRELRDTREIRRWVVKKMNLEFAEMLQTTTGKLLDQISVRDFNLGSTFPVIRNSCVKNVVLKDTDTCQGLEQLDIQLDLVYHGGFQLAVDVDLVFGKSAYLSVKVKELRGVARLQFSRIPFTHWSFSFIEEPVIDFEVESQYEGRPIPRLTSLIISQIRRSIRKKHTLPSYKFRYRPFFIKPENKPPCSDIYFQGKRLSTGQLEVTVVECNRLLRVSPDCYLYCTLAIDNMPWQEMMSSRRKLWVSLDVEVIKVQQLSIGINFREDFILDKYEEMVVVDSIQANTPAQTADIRKGDVVIAVGGIKVTTSKQAVKLIKQAGERFTIRIERCNPLKGLEADFKFEEDTISLREIKETFEAIVSRVQDSDTGEGMASGGDEDMEEYVNISITPVDQTEKNGTKDKHDKAPPGGEEDNPSLPPSPRKGLSFLASSANLFHRKRARPNSTERQPRDSPELKPKIPSVSYKSGTEDLKIPQRRAKSDVTPILKEKQQALSEQAQATSTFETESASTTSIPCKMESRTECAEEENFDLKRTKFVKASELQDPQWHEKFSFDIDSCHQYLNVCVWCRVPEKLDKQNRVVKPEKDILLGHVSVSLMDISLECLSTLQGDLRQTFKLTPSEMKAGANRMKMSSLSSHPGFDEKLCFGDITLMFVHTTQLMTREERRSLEREKVQKEQTAEKRMRESQAETSPIRERRKGHHDFESTHFQSATYCNFCHKKIWLKVAFQCCVCGMTCHKKCIEKCQAQTICSKDGFRFRHAPPGINMKPSLDGLDNSYNTTQPAHRSFLSKFGRKESPRLARKDDTKDTTKSIMTNVPKIVKTGVKGEIIRERLRRNSAPGDSTEEEDVNKDRLSLEDSLPRTRSSTSLQDLLQENASPSLQPKEFYPGGESDTSSIMSTDSDDEMNLLRFFEKQKSSPNADELVVTAAKEMGKELYANLSFDERREKLDSMVSKLQMEIDTESESRAEYSRLEQEASDPVSRKQIQNKIANSDEKIQALALLMLHYCAGLQHCLDQQMEERQEREQQEKMQSSVREGAEETEKPEINCSSEEAFDQELGAVGGQPIGTQQLRGMARGQPIGIQQVQGTVGGQPIGSQKDNPSKGNGPRMGQKKGKNMHPNSSVKDTNSCSKGHI